ncbi:ABC transporter permease [Paenibacillus terrigena]|uniref:ABC transporter permease n=1 Tax=Paenibacillus terrigena TaxID=369333 RepID=UPI0003621F60|nr:ABC transporter permease [Paenibacillus terrigena]
MSNMKTIVGFTFKNKVKTKSFIVTTIILILLVTAGINSFYVMSLFNKDEGGPAKAEVVAMVNDTEGVAPALQAYYKKQSDSKLSIQVNDGSGDPATDEAKLKQDLAAKKIAGYLVASEGKAGEFPKFIYKSSNIRVTGDSTTKSLETALGSVKTDFIVADSLTDAQKKQLSEPITMSLEQVAVSEGNAGTNQTEEQKIAANILVYVMLFLFFMTAYMTGNMIAAEVTAEKSSRIMEILITSVSPLSQMFGKVMGMFLVGLTQIAVFVAAVAVNVNLPHNVAVLKEAHIDMSQIDPMLLIYGLVFYILGYFLFAVLFAAVGSMVSRTEDLGQAIMPITLLSLASFYISMFSLATPNTMLVKVASFIPFTSPTSMILRLGLGEVAYWEVWLSIVLLLVAIFIFGWLSAKIYRTGVLMYGKRPSWKELRKAMKAYKI